VNRRAPHPGNRHSRSRWRNLAKQPRRHLATQSTDAQDVAIPIFRDRLHPGVAQQAPDRLGMDHWAALDLAAAGVFLQAVQPRVHHDGGSIGFRIGCDPRRTQRHQGVGPASGGVHLALFTGHRRDPLCLPFQGVHDHRSGRGGEIGLQTEAAAVVVVPPGDLAAALGLPDVFDLGLVFEVGAVADRTDRDRPRPADQSCFVIRCGEPGQLDNLVDAELPSLERVADQRQAFEGVRRADPPPGLPFGDAVADGQPVRRVARTGITPHLAAIRGDNEVQQVSLRATHVCIRSVESEGKGLHRRCRVEHECDANTRH
jgi:hypothetical protein